MRNAGEILFIGERRQLVFHVVPHPSRLGHFHQVYAQALGFQPVTDRAHVVALSKREGVAPSVSAEVIAVLPSGDVAEEWWVANHDHSDITVEVVAAPEIAVTTSPLDTDVNVSGAILLMIAASGLGLAVTWRLLYRPSPAYALLRNS
jgi:hypothetical protein